MYFMICFSMINVSFMQWKFYLGRHPQKYGLQNGTYDIGVLLLGDMRYTFQDPT